MRTSTCEVSEVPVDPEWISRGEGDPGDGNWTRFVERQEGALLEDRACPDLDDAVEPRDPERLERVAIQNLCGGRGVQSLEHGQNQVKFQNGGTFFPAKNFCDQRLQTSMVSTPFARTLI